MAQNAGEGLRLHVLALGGGRVTREAVWRLALDAQTSGYADAQIDDYGDARRPPGMPRFQHHPGRALSLRARFSQPIDRLRGTAGFGFWNAPYGDPSSRRLALPGAAWFFFASEPNDLPFAPESGRGWFAATIDATTPGALALVPAAPVALLLHQFAPLRHRLWPAIRRRLGIAAVALDLHLDVWHDYRLEWRRDTCRFLVDSGLVLTAAAPRGPLGFVCWIDNQYLILTPRGRFRAGVLPLAHDQALEVADLAITPLNGGQPD